jgi:hypothetical protein
MLSDLRKRALQIKNGQPSKETQAEIYAAKGVDQIQIGLKRAASPDYQISSSKQSAQAEEAANANPKENRKQRRK